jgi:hypothetical protein
VSPVRLNLRLNALRRTRGAIFCVSSETLRRTSYLALLLYIPRLNGLRRTVRRTSVETCRVLRTSQSQREALEAALRIFHRSTYECVAFIDGIRGDKANLSVRACTCEGPIT